MSDARDSPNGVGVVFVRPVLTSAVVGVPCIRCSLSPVGQVVAQVLKLVAHISEPLPLAGDERSAFERPLGLTAGEITRGKNCRVPIGASLMTGGAVMRSCEQGVSAVPFREGTLHPGFGTRQAFLSFVAGYLCIRRAPAVVPWR